jgi:CheY-like chemotaxis protein
MNQSVLYIEDDDNNISLVEALLRRRPHIELQVAMNGRDGVQAAIDKQPGLILLDNRLPDATGSEILQELGSTSATAAIPVVVLSSDPDELIDQLLANGAAEAVPKPFDIHLFMAMIDRYFPAIGTLASGYVTSRVSSAPGRTSGRTACSRSGPRRSRWRSRPARPAAAAAARPLPGPGRSGYSRQ